MRVVIADEMEPEVVREIEKLGDVVYKPPNLREELLSADVLIVRSATKVTRELLSDARNLKVVARAGVGLDNVDADVCRERGIKVLNTPGASSNAVAELAIGLIIASFRNVQKAHLQMRAEGKWDKKNLLGMEIEGRTLGIVGYGRIGALLAKKATALGMNVVAYDPLQPHGDGVATMLDSLDSLLAQADVISIHAALTEGTRHMFNRDTLARMKDGAFIINAARGDIIDEEALYDACKSGKLGGAALDVYRSEPYKGRLLELDNVYFTPHLGASTKEAQVRIGQELVSLLRAELMALTSTIEPPRGFVRAPVQGPTNTSAAGDRERPEPLRRAR